jgi:kynurenine formamidase
VDRALLAANSPRAWRSAKFVEDAVHLTAEAARWLAARPVRTIGIDYLSVGGFAADNGAAVHQPLLAAGVAIIVGGGENLEDIRRSYFFDERLGYLRNYRIEPTEIIRTRAEPFVTT